jgi:hypothetical protein
VPNGEFVLGSGFKIHLFWCAKNFILRERQALLFIMLLTPLILADRFILACLISVPSEGSSMLTQHFERIAKHSEKFRQKIILQNKSPPN